jgi:D-alanyl-D-alanine carboxypeptidase
VGPSALRRVFVSYVGFDGRAHRGELVVNGAVAPGPKRWSVHAYGEAIDVDTVENPYLEGGRVLPASGPLPAVCSFAAVGWLWGGRWTASPDWQHFSKTGG